MLLSAAILGILPAMIGCEGLAFFRVRIEDFGNGNVAGLWLWREDERTRDYLRDTRLPFDGIEGRRGSEILYYRVGADQTPWAAAVQRDASQPAAIIVELALEVREVPTVWRATAYSGFGESELSSQTMVH